MAPASTGAVLIRCFIDDSISATSRSISAWLGGAAWASAITARTSRSAASQSSPTGSTCTVVMFADRPMSLRSAPAAMKVPPERARVSSRRLMMRIATRSIIRFWLKITVSPSTVQGRTIAMVVSTGSAGSTMLAATGVPSTGLPKSGVGTAGPVPFQSEKCLTIICSSSAGSTSPIAMTVARSGRYQRSWNACTLAGVAATSVSTVPIGSRCDSGWPANIRSSIASCSRTCGPGCSRCSASTTGRSESRICCVICGPDIMPARILKLSSSPAGDAIGRSSL